MTAGKVTLLKELVLEAGQKRSARSISGTFMT
jgi:hypothetical protein